MKKIIFAVILIVVSSSSFAACDAAGAVQLQSSLRQLGSWKNVGSVVEFKWGPAFDDLTPSERLKMLEAFANTDACIYGKARAIDFYRKGKLVGRASPTFGIKLVD